MLEVEELNVAALWLRLWQFRRTIAIAIVVGGLGALVYALIATPIFRAQVTVTEVSSGNSNPLNSLPEQLGGIASIVGLNLGPGGTNRQAEALLRSRYLVEQFINRHGPVSQFFPHDKKRNSLWFVVRRFQRDVLS